MCLFYLVINVCWHIIWVAIVCYHGMLMCLFYYLAVNLCCHIIWFACAIVNYHDMSMFYHWRLFSQLFGCHSLLELLFLLLTVILFLHELWNVLLINDLNHDRQTLLKVWESMSRFLTSILLIVQRNWRASSQVGQTWQPSQHFSQHIIYEEAKYLMSNKCKSFFFCRRGDMEL